VCTVSRVLILGLMVLAEEVLTHGNASSVSTLAEDHAVAFASSHEKRTRC